MTKNPYQILNIPNNASLSDIKAAYRLLVKKYHPDAGGDQKKFLEIHAAWKLLKDKNNQPNYQKQKNQSIKTCSSVNPRIRNGLYQDKEIALWQKFVYFPIDHLMGDIMNPFEKELRELSADPYDEKLMESFCKYIKTSQKKIKKIQDIYQSIPTPMQIRSFSLCLYQCFSEMQDGINEWERYSAGYIESYLHDGNEMLRKAQKQRLMLQKDNKSFADY